MGRRAEIAKAMRDEGSLEKSHHKQYYNKGKHRGCSLTVWMQTLLSKRECARVYKGLCMKLGCVQILRWISLSLLAMRWCWLKNKGRVPRTKKVISLVTGSEEPFRLSAFLILLPCCVCLLLFCVVEVDSIPPQRESTQRAWRTRSFALSWSNSHNKYTGTRQRKGGD